MSAELEVRSQTARLRHVGARNWRKPGEIGLGNFNLDRWIRMIDTLPAKRNSRRASVLVSGVASTGYVGCAEIKRVACLHCASRDLDPMSCYVITVPKITLKEQYHEYFRRFCSCDV